MALCIRNGVISLCFSLLQNIFFWEFFRWPPSQLEELRYLNIFHHHSGAWKCGIDPPMVFVPHSLRKPYYPPTQRAEWVPDADRLEIWSSHMMLKVMLTLDLPWENVHKLFKPQHQWQDCSLFCYLKHAEDSLDCFVGAILWANLGWISYWLMSVYTWNRVIEYPPRHACSVDYLLVYHVLGVTSHFWVWNNPFR